MGDSPLRQGERHHLSCLATFATDVHSFSSRGIGCCWPKRSLSRQKHILDEAAPSLLKEEDWKRKKVRAFVKEIANI
jgi:hypothetical protein